MKTVALGLLLLLPLSACTRYGLNSASVLDYARDDSAPLIAGKTVVNAGPWILIGAAYACLALIRIAPEAALLAVDAATSR